MLSGPGLHGEADAPFDVTNSATAAEGFDLANLPADYYTNPYPYYRALRDHAPVKRMPDGSWFLTRYRDILPVYRDPHAWSSDKKREFAPKYGVTPLYEHHTTSLVFNDPPLHTRVRRAIVGALSQRHIAAMEPGLRMTVAGGIYFPKAAYLAPWQTSCIRQWLSLRMFGATGNV
jgi:cytochrome P450